VKHLDIKALADGTAELTIFGPIGEGFLSKSITPQTIDDDLKALGEPREILVRISSEGGSVFDALAIRTALAAHPAKIRVRVEGLAASAATIVMLAADPGELEIADGAMLMIHSPWMLAAGDADDLRKSAGVLDQVEGEMISLYSARTKLSASRIKSLLDAETWMNAAQAVEQGFADAVFDTEERPRLAARAQFLSLCRNAPSEVYAMPNPNPNPPVDRSAILAAEQTRRSEIRSRFGRFATDFRGLLDECLDDTSCTPQAASEKLLAKMGEGCEPMYPSYGQRLPDPVGEDFVGAASDALLIRAGIRVEKPHPGARDIGRMSVADLCRAALSRAGKSTAHLTDRSRLIKAALSTSDFPSLLENSLGKALRNGYELDPQSHTAWVRFTMVPDFKTVSRLLLGSAPALETVPEGSEYKYGALSEDKASLAVTKYGKALLMTWETLINDDLAAFMRVPQAMGQAARRLEADKVYEIFTANSGAGQTMQDSVALFHSGSHGNVSATVGAISTATLGAGRSLLRKQQALGNGGYLNLVPRFLIVPSESETLAEQILAAATRHVSGTESTSARRVDSPTPEWISRLQLVVEPRLNATYGFYLAAGSDQIDTVELASLEADGGAPYLEEESEFDRDARAYKVRHTFVAKAIDWKGLVRVPAT